MKQRNVCVVNRAIITHEGPLVGTQRFHRCRSELQPACRSISQSGNRTEDLDWTLEPNRSVSSCSSWLLWSSCLECDSDSNDVWGSMFSFPFFLLLLPKEVTGVTRWEETVFKKPWTGLRVHDSLANVTTTQRPLFPSFLCRGAPSPLTLMIVWETFKIKNNKTKRLIDLNDFYLLIASLCNAGDNVYFSTNLLKSPPVWVRIGVMVVKQSCFCPVLSTLW